MLLSIAALAFAWTLSPFQEGADSDYDGAVCCAGLAQAASEHQGRHGQPDGRLADAALYWGLTAVRAGAALGRSDAQIDADQTLRRADAAEAFTHQNKQFTDELEACLARTPELN